MKTLNLKNLLLTLLATAAFACTDDDDFTPVKDQAVAVITGINGNSVSGTATFLEIGNSVTLTLELEGLSPGEHAVHLHTGTCENIGSHWNPTDEKHGRRAVTKEFHRGDIGNVEIGSDGTGSLTITAKDWTIGGKSSTDVRNKLVIVHQGADDYVSQPSGNSGAMIGCGMIE